MYCPQCLVLFDGKERCPVCAGRKIREPLPEDPCFLTETDPVFGGMLRDVLAQNGIPALSASTIGAGMAARAGSMFERIRFHVRCEDLERASGLVRALFDAPIVPDEAAGSGETS